METVVIVIHLMIVLALVGVVLMQRSEGGGLGIGGGSGFAAARGSGNALTRATAILAVLFFATSLTLSIMARYGERETDILDRIQQQSPAAPGTGSGGVLDQLGGPSAPPATSGESQPAPAVPDAQGGDAATGVPSDAAPAQEQAPAVPSGQ